MIVNIMYMRMEDTSLGLLVEGKSESVSCLVVSHSLRLHGL